MPEFLLRVISQSGKQQYYNEAAINCPSCGEEVLLNAQEVHCPYCGAFVTHNFFDWQAESFDFYDKIGNTTKLLLISLGLWGFIFLGLGIAFSLYSLSKILTIALIVGVIALPICHIWFAGSKQKALQKKIVRYSESYLRTCINEELWQREDKTDLLSFSVNRIKLKSVNHRNDQTYIILQAGISKTFVKNNGQLINKKENISLCMNRVKNPSRIKAKGEVFAEEECPSCGANFMPDENNNCSYCGYGLQVYNGRWKLA